MKVLFRAEGSNTVGAGHVMRCIALGQTLLDEGHEVFFMCFETSPHYLAIIRSMLCEPICRQGSSGSSEDAVQTCAFAVAHNIDWIIVDTYAADTCYMSTVGDSGAKIAVIDDIADREMYADMIVNQSLGAEALIYQLKKPTKMLLGLPYVMLRREYRRSSNVRVRTQQGTRQILLSLGGSPPFEHLRKLLRATLKAMDSSSQLRVIVGALEDQKNEILQSDIDDASSNRSVIFLPWMESLYEELAQAHLFIAASGSSVFEALVLELPMLLCYFAENQKVIYSALTTQGGCLGIGDLSELSESDITDALTALLRNHGCIPKPKISCLDSSGTMRIVNELTNHLKLHD